MDLRKRKRQIALLLVAILIPVVVLIGLTVRVVGQEAELSDKRAADQRREALDQLRRELSARLQTVKLQEVNRLIGESGPGLPPDSPILFVAPLEQDRMILPWEISRPAEEASLQFAESQAKGEALEFRTGDAHGAVSAYKQALVEARGQAQQCEAMLWIGRALRKADLAEEAALSDRAMLDECDAVADDDYIPFGLYAAERLVTGHHHVDAARDYLLRHAAAAGRRPPAQAYLLRSLLNSPSIAAGSASQKLSIEIHETERLQALANDIHDQLGRIKLGFRTAPGDLAWIGYGDEPWLVTVMSPTPFAAPMVMAVSSARIKPDGVALSSQPTETSTPLGEGFVDVHVDWQAGRFVTPSGMSSSLYGMGLLFIFGVTLFAAYLLLRDVHREVELAETRSHFVASVSHELKTPLTAIRMYAETLHMGRSPDKDQTAEYLQTIVNESERLSRLVDNVLDFSRIEKGCKIYRMQPTCLADVVRSAARTMQYPLSELGFTLNVSIDAALPPLRADADALEQAILNLLTNAMKYSGDARQIELCLKGAGNEAAIEVVDHGIGISPDDQARIFEKFYRVRSAETDRVAGTGLGLTIAQHIVEAHRGRVEVSSAVGRGSVFSVRIPWESPA